MLWFTTSRFANPFIVGRDGSREEVIDKFAKWLPTQKILLESLHELDGKTVACWCSYPQEDCHGRVLIEAREKQINMPYLNENPEAKKVAVIGSRKISAAARKEVFEVLDRNKHRIKMIISGGCRNSADEVSQEWAQQRGVPILINYARWYEDDGSVRRKGGYERNYFIIKDCDIVLAWHDGSSRGTQNSLDIAKKLNKPTKIFYFTPDQEENNAPEVPPEPKKRGRKPKQKPDGQETPKTEEKPAHVIQNSPTYEEGSVEI